MRGGLVVAAVLVACTSVEPPPPLQKPRRAVVAPAGPVSSRELPITFPETPPFRLSHSFEPVRYDARLALGDHDFSGHIEITGDAREELSLVWLHGVDLMVTHASARSDAGEVPLEFSGPRDDQTLGFRPTHPLAPGRWVIAIDYTGPIRESDPAQRMPWGPGARMGLGLFRRIVDGATYLFTQSEAIYARRIFPCIDEPDRKVPWQLTLDVRRGLVAASNTPIATTTPLDRDHARVTFAQTAPLPSYLVAFAVGPFDVVEAKPSKSGTPIRVLAQRGQGAKLADAARVAPQILDLLERWLGVPYAYGKLDLVSVPDAGWGAMENPGLVTFNRTYLEKDPASIVAHELTHQWFGDLVTCAWWDDIWLNESFAELFAEEIQRALDPASPPYDLADERLEGLNTESWGAVSHPAISSHDLEFSEFAPSQTISAGASRLRLVEAYLGTDAFRGALHRYLEAHAHGSATTNDLVDALATTSRAFSKPVLGDLISRSPPVLGFELRCDRPARVEVSKITFDMPVCVAYDRDGSRAEACATVSTQNTTIPLPARRCPRN